MTDSSQWPDDSYADDFEGDTQLQDEYGPQTLPHHNSLVNDSPPQTFPLSDLSMLADHSSLLRKSLPDERDPISASNLFKVDAVTVETKGLEVAQQSDLLSPKALTGSDMPSRRLQYPSASSSLRTRHSKINRVTDLSDIPGLHYSRTRIDSAASQSQRHQLQPSKDHVISFLSTVLTNASERSISKAKSSPKLSRRSVPVPSLQTALKYEEVSRIVSMQRVLATAHHDPDYVYAMNLLETREGGQFQPKFSDSQFSSMHQQSPLRVAPTNRFETRAGIAEEAPKNNFNTDQRDQPIRPTADGDHRSRAVNVALAGFGPCVTHTEEHIPTSFNQFMAIDFVGADREAETLNRLGLDRDQLSDKAGEIYANFLSDVIELCRSRARDSSSLEEAAMHRALAAHVSKSFSPKVCM